MSTVLNTTIELMGAGRTDTGVHAKIMYAHFDLEKEFQTNSIVHKLNSFLPKDIAVFDIVPVAENAHARFDAKKRTYEYHIHTFKNVFQNELSWYNPQKLDVNLMNEAAKILKNLKDNEVEFVKFCQMIDMLDRHDDHLIMKQRIKRLNGEARQSGIDAFEW